MSMATVWLVPEGTDSADSASAGDYVLRPRPGHAGQYEVGKQTDHLTWLGSLSGGLLPPLPAVDAPQEAPEQQRLLAAVQGVESAETHRGG
jgi:hypothetical protein